VSTVRARLPEIIKGLKPDWVLLPMPPPLGTIGSPQQLQNHNPPPV